MSEERKAGHHNTMELENSVHSQSPHKNSLVQEHEPREPAPTEEVPHSHVNMATLKMPSAEQEVLNNSHEGGHSHHKTPAMVSPQKSGRVAENIDEKKHHTSSVNVGQHFDNGSMVRNSSIESAERSTAPELKTVQHTSSDNNQRQSSQQKQTSIPGLVLDELTEYAMAKEGIELKDLEIKPFDDFLKECNGNQKLAQLRYEFKEMERQSLLQDIENRKQMIQMEMHRDTVQNTAQASAQNSRFYVTAQQPSLMQSRMSRGSQSQSHFYNSGSQLLSQKASGQSLMSPNNQRNTSKNQVDNKIFNNMMKNQVDQEVKLRQIQERQEMFLMKANMMQEKRNQEIQKKQEILHQKQALKEEKLRKQEEEQKKWQTETLQKLKIKSEISQNRQLKMKHDMKQRMQEHMTLKELKKQHAQEMLNQYLDSLEKRHHDVENKNKEFQRKLEDRARRQKEMIEQKKIKKEQVLNSVQELRDLEEHKKMERFMFAQFCEMEKERRLEEQKQREAIQRKQKGQEKNHKIQNKIEETYQKMAEWQSELERREKQAAENLKKQQQILAEKLQIKREMQRLRQESAQLKQKRKENKEKLKKDEQMQELQTLSMKFEEFKKLKDYEKWQKQQEIFKAEQKRADMRQAFYHMAVWNVNEAGDLIKEIIEEADKCAGVKPKSVAEKVREKAALIRRNERLGLSKMSPGGIEEEQHDQVDEIMGFGHYGNRRVNGSMNGHKNGQDFERGHINEQH